MGFWSLIIESRPTLSRIAEYHHHFEEQLQIGRHNSRQNRWLQWTGICLPRRKRSSFWGFLFLQTDLSFEVGIMDDLFSAEAIFASSTSKFGMCIPSTEHEDFRSSTESTNSTSLIRSIISIGNCEQAHTTVLNLIFQQANVAGVVNMSKWRSEICSRCWSAPKLFEKSPSLGMTEFLADCPDWHLWSWTGVWLSLITCGDVCSDTLGLHGFNSFGQSAEKSAVGFAKNVSQFSMCAPNALRPVFCGLALPENGLAFHQDLEKVGKTLLDWQRGIVHCVLIQHLENLSNHSTINFIL